ncbi:MAG TPA: ABC transporter substrate-binding protein [Acetobacteraceae bacterium]|nr:ABC transporter substrate-binding protein [Acetobacteraceae bacterium]
MLTRRTLLASSAAAVAAPAVLTQARAATPKGIAVMARRIDDIVSFDPAESYEFTNGEVDGNCYRRLIRPNLDDVTKIEGDLAESWTVSPDGLTFTFKLRRDAKFDSGNPVTANDAVFSLHRVVKLNKTPGFIITQFGFKPDNVEQMIRALDDYTLEMKLPEEAEATSFVQYCLSANIGSVVDMKTAMANQTNGDLGNAWLKSRTAGAGPYKLTEWAASDHVIIDTNPQAAEKPLMRRIVIRHVADPSAQLLLLQKGDVDMARDLTSDQLKSVAGDKDLTVVSSPQGTSMYIAMNQTMPELQKVQVHQAIKWAIDYDAIANNITPNTWSVCQSFLPDALPGALKSNAFKKDVAKAKQLLAEAGLANGFAATMDYVNTSPSSEIAQAIQADLAAIGIKLSLLPGDQKQVITKTRARQHQLAMLRWGTDYFDPNSNCQAWCENPDDSDQSKLKILAWRSHFVDQELTSESQAAVRELDPAKRIALYHKIQQQFMERAPFAMLLQQDAVTVLGKGVSGFKVGPMPDYTQYSKITKA